MLFDASHPDDTNKPIGDRIRDIINPAMADARRKKIQLDYLDGQFAIYEQNIAMILEEAFAKFSNKVALAERKGDDVRLRFIINALMIVPDNAPPEYMPILQYNLPIVNAFTDFTAEEVKKLPNYIKLHLRARELNVALDFTGLLAGEGRMGPPQPVVTIDALRTYEQGALDNAELYPNLPDPTPTLDPNRGGRLRLK